MGRPSASYRREFDKNMREAREEGKRRREAEQPKLDRDSAPARRASRKEQVKAAFDALKVGDSLAYWGMAGTVAKKNKKSFVTTMGNKYTLKELGGE